MTQQEFIFDAGPVENRKARAAEAVKPEQPDIPREPTETGYWKYVAERNAALKRLEERFGLVLNRPVRLSLAGFPNEFTGRVLVDEILPSKKRKGLLRLRIGDVQFEPRDVEACVSITEA